MRHPEPDLNPPEFYDEPLEWDDLPDEVRAEFDSDWISEDDQPADIRAALEYAQDTQPIITPAADLLKRWDTAREQYAEQWSAEHPEACKAKKQQEEPEP